MGFNDALGLRLAADGATVELDPAAEHEAAPGTVHFAVLATLGEVAAARAAGVPVVPAQLSVQLLRRAVSGARLEGRGRVLRAGKTLVFAEGEVTQAGERVAVVAVTFARIG
jgi:acyl-coenzyme A thioesterase PaaI-like protein